MHDSDISMPMHEGRELPTVYFREIDLPELKGWKVGGEYLLMIEVEQISLNNLSDAPTGSDKKKLEATFRIKSVKAVVDEKAELKTETEKALGSHGKGY